MPSYDLIIKNVKIVNENSVRESEIYVKDGKIANIGFELSTQSADVIIDGKGMLALPGLIDVHVHFRDPGMTHKEDFETGTKGAAAGGTTTILDMPTTQPVVTSSELLISKLNSVADKALVDFGLYGAASVDNLDKIEGLAKAGAIAFKTYTVSPPAERIREYEGAVVKTAGELLRVLQESSRIGLVHCIHAEDDSIIQVLSGRLQSEGRKDPEAHCESRPNLAEALAVYYACGIAQITGARIHILHVSTKEAVQIIRNAKAKGVKVTAETCPHYLLFTRKDMQKFGPYGKYNPPARSDEDVAALWEGLADGTIDIIASDHAPHSREEKDAGREDIWRAPPGTPGVETRLPVVLSKSSSWGLSMHDLVRLLSKNPAKIFGLEPQKGSLVEGADADITLLDPEVLWKIKSSELQTKARDTVIYDQMQVRGQVAYTILRGRVIYERGAGFERPGFGRFLANKYSALIK